jgi:hypothetical protein
VVRQARERLLQTESGHPVRAGGDDVLGEAAPRRCTEQANPVGVEEHARRPRLEVGEDRHAAVELQRRDQEP